MAASKKNFTRSSRTAPLELKIAGRNVAAWKRSKGGVSVKPENGQNHWDRISPNGSLRERFIDAAQAAGFSEADAVKAARNLSFS